MNEKSDFEKRMISASGAPESVSMQSVSVVLLGSNPARRQSLDGVLAGSQAKIARSAVLPAMDALASLIEHDCDVLIVDIDDDTERALELVEAASAINPSLTVMVYARAKDPDLMVRCMRARAREFLIDPISPSTVTEALVHASVRLDEVRRQKKATGKCLTFVGAKGGVGVTTIAANFAVALALESESSVALVDLNLNLGDAALDLGLASQYSTLDALQNETRMDSDLVAKLMVPHSTGLQVLAAPDGYNTFQPTEASVVKLINILRGDFSWVVIDAGTHAGRFEKHLFEISHKVFLVTQVSVADLRNANRFITANFAGEGSEKLEVVLNRYTPRVDEIREDSIARALTVTPAWKIPNDYQAVRGAQNAAAALALKNGPVTTALTQMARTVCGKPEKKKGKFSLFG
jgi:pilus assembly protein CpaE